jgi:hypothetical protein
MVCSDLAATKVASRLSRIAMLGYMTLWRWWRTPCFLCETVGALNPAMDDGADPPLLDSTRLARTAGIVVNVSEDTMPPITPVYLAYQPLLENRGLRSIWH